MVCSRFFSSNLGYNATMSSARPRKSSYTERRKSAHRLRFSLNFLAEKTARLCLSWASPSTNPEGPLLWEPRSWHHHPPCLGSRSVYPKDSCAPKHMSACVVCSSRPPACRGKGLFLSMGWMVHFFISFWLRVDQAPLQARGPVLKKKKHP